MTATTSTVLHRQAAVSSPPAEDRLSVRHRIVNTRLLVGTVVVFAAVGLASFFWHRHQIEKTAGVLKLRAAQLEGERKWSAAANLLYKYLQIVPDDVDAHVQLVEDLDKSAVTPAQKTALLERYYRAVGLAPDRIPLRVRLIELLLDARRFAEAQIETRRLLNGDDEYNIVKDPRNPALLRLLALAMHGLNRMGGSVTLLDAVAALERAIEAERSRNRLDTVLAASYAYLLREEAINLADRKPGPVQKADAAVDDLVKLNPKNPSVLLTAFAYELQFQVPGADQRLKQAIQIAPDLPEVLLVAGQRALETKDYAQARKYYARVLEKSPQLELGHVGLGKALRAENKLADAIQAWRTGLEKVGKDNIDLNANLVDALLEMGRVREAGDALADLTAAAHRRLPLLLGPTWLALRDSVELMRARWLIADGQHVRAVTVLKRLTAGRKGSDGKATKANAANTVENVEPLLHLASAYATLGHWDQAATAYERVAVLRPDLYQPRLAAASAWASAGRPDVAAVQFQQVLEIDGAPKNVATSLARAMMDRELARPKNERSWIEFQRVLDQARRADPDSWQVALVEADFFALASDMAGVDKAVALLRATEARHPKDQELWPRLVSMYNRLDRPADADRALGKVEEILGNKSTAATLLRAELLAGRKQFDAALALLDAALPSLPETERPLVKRQLALVAMRAGKRERVRQQLLDLHQGSPTGAEAPRRLAELALDNRDFADAERWESVLRQMEGEDGAIWKSVAVRRLLMQSKTKNDPRIKQADRWLTDIEADRPHWPAAFVLRGLLVETQGNYRQAIESYRTAIQLGEQQVAAFERLIALLLGERRFAEAEELLTRLDRSVAASQALSSLAISSAAGQDQTARAVDRARQAALQQPNQVIPQLWLGSTLILDKQNAQAERVLRDATAKWPADERAWSGLFSFYVRTNNPDLAKQTLKKLAEKTRLSAAEQSFVLAQGHEMLGDLQQAEALYRQAAKLEPDSAAVQTRLAGLLLRTNVFEAEAALRRVLELAPESDNARRALASLLALRGGEAEWQEAQRLLESTTAANAEISSLDDRLRAILLLRRGGSENLSKARRILKRLVDNPNVAAPGDYLMLAAIYDGEGQLENARSQFRALIDRPKPNPTHVAAYIDFLLRHDFTADAETALAQFERDPKQRAGAIGLRARLLKQQGKQAEVVALVDAYANPLWKSKTEKPDRVTLCTQMGAVYATVDMHEQAEFWFRRLVELEPKGYQLLASCLVRQKKNRASEAIDLCLDAAGRDASATPAIVLATILSAAKPTAEDFRRAEPILAQAMQKHPGNVELLFAVAVLRSSRGQNDDAVRLFRQVVKLTPKRVIALNNLATLLAERSDSRQEALTFIERAIEIAGPQSSLLDTKGTILLLDDNSRDAADTLRQATAVAGADPRSLFHLAVAYFRLGDAVKARKALQQARVNGLENQVLTTSDQGMLEQLDRSL